MRLGVLLFHRITLEPDPANVYTLPADRFDAILVEVRALGLHFEDPWGSPRRGAQDYALAATFDDGFQSDYSLAFPRLLNAHSSATFFITTEWVGRQDRVTWAQLAEMGHSGMTIGSHTHTHPYLATLSVDAVREELVRSKGLIEHATGTEVTVLSLPEGSGSARVLELALEAGYRRVCTSEWGWNRMLDVGCPFRVRRMCVDQRVSARQTSALLHGRRRAYQAVAMVVKNGVRRLIGDRWYGAMERRYHSSSYER